MQFLRSTVLLSLVFLLRLKAFTGKLLATLPGMATILDRSDLNRLSGNQIAILCAIGETLEALEARHGFACADTALATVEAGTVASPLRAAKLASNPAAKRTGMRNDWFVAFEAGKVARLSGNTAAIPACFK